MLILKDPIHQELVSIAPFQRVEAGLPAKAQTGREEKRHILLRIERQKRQIQDERGPVPIDQEKEGQESMHSSFWDDISVESITEINGIDVVAAWKQIEWVSRHRVMSGKRRRKRKDIPLQITIHDREEDLKEEVHGIDEDREEVEPGFTRHVDGGSSGGSGDESVQRWLL